MADDVKARETREVDQGPNVVRKVDSQQDGDCPRCPIFLRNRVRIDEGLRNNKPMEMPLKGMLHKFGSADVRSEKVSLRRIFVGAGNGGRRHELFVLRTSEDDGMRFQREMDGGCVL